MKTNLIMAGLAALLIGLGGGYVMGVAAGSDSASETSETASHADSHNDGGGAHTQDSDSHSHSQLQMVSAEQAPSISLNVTEDELSGWNVSINTENFSFAPENINSAPVIGEKISRLYGSNYHYDQNFDGTKTFRVTLNANNHAEYAVDWEVIEASVDITHAAHN